MTDVYDEETLWATDSLLDALSVGDPVGDDRGLSLLAALVADIGADLPETAPIPVAPDELGRRRSRLLRLAPRTGVALAAAVAVVSTGGVAAASVTAGPTSPLFPLHQVLTGQPQLDGSQRQALEVRDKLRSASKALAAGKVDRAEKDVSAAAGRIAKVDVRDGRRDLAAQWTMLNKQVKARAVAPVVPAVVPAKPTETTVPTPVPTLSPTVSGKPAVSPSPTLSHSPSSTPTVAPAPTTTPVTTSAAPTSVTPTPVAPTSAEPSGSVGSSAAPSGSDSPSPSDTPSKGGHKGTTTPSAAPGSPIDPIVITPEPSDTGSQVPNGDTVPPPSDAPASSQPSASAAVTTTPPPASAQPSG
ncbi:hypothetical protein acdb102_07240 [Acidothermaceae bacterium B102]|nr:hypothetical protein acdb102_07240 [Acidothermaceae bacterium B102]